uniref:Uncharacterized protein n=1 Tax=Oryza punctata TaxID=4537 RepID=A0A0E0JK92_ORYPU
MEEEDGTVIGKLWLVVVEVKALLRASLPDIKQQINQQGGVHQRQEQQPVAAPCRRHYQNKQVLHLHIMLHVASRKE